MIYPINIDTNFLKKMITGYTKSEENSAKSMIISIIKSMIHSMMKE